MDLESQVCTFEQAKKMKELGVKQESTYYWYSAGNSMNGGDVFYGHDFNQGWWMDYELKGDEMRLAAFNVAELGELLPPCFVSDKRHVIGNSRWACKQSWTRRCGSDGMECYPLVDFACFKKTEAEARADMLILLLEKKIISL